MSDYVCEDCGKAYKSRSGLWKHQKKMRHGKFADQETESEVIPIMETSQSVGGESDPSTSSLNTSASDEAPPTDTDERPSWMDWEFDDQEASDVLPTAFKSIATSPQMGSSKLSKAQREALEKQNKAILKMGLTAIDAGLTRYGRAVSLDEDFTVSHTEEDKDLVAGAQYRYLEEKGLFLTNYLSSGVIAASLTGWYIAVPMYRIRKNAKKKLIRGRLLSRLPLIGRFFKPKDEIPDIGQNTEVVA